MLQPNLGAIIVVTPCIWTFSSEVKLLGYGVRVSKSFSLKNSKIHRLVWGKSTYLVLKYMSNSNLVCAFENLIRNFSVNYNFDFETKLLHSPHCAVLQLWAPPIKITLFGLNWAVKTTTIRDFGFFEEKFRNRFSKNTAIMVYHSKNWVWRSPSQL